VKVLVFGGSGFLGNAICNSLKNSKYDIYSTYLNNNEGDFKIDITNYLDFKRLPINFFNIIINCVSKLPDKSYLDQKNLLETFDTNIKGAQNLCNWLINQKTIKKIINCSTLAVNKKPWDLNITEEIETYNHGKHVVYSSSKLFQELILKTFCEENSISLGQIRFSSIYGEKMKKNGIIWNLQKRILNEEKITLFNSTKTSFDFLHVEDAASIVKSVIMNDYNGILNAASGREITLLELASLIANIISPNTEIINKFSKKFPENRSVISLKKLKQIIDPLLFKKFDISITKLFY
jgi:UDP-glucose 4-epimerase